MVEINNQRKAFLDMLAWSEDINGRQKTRNHGYDVIVGGENCYWLLRSPSQTCHADQNSNPTSAGRYQLLSRWWDACKQLGLKRLLSKSQDAVALQQIKERGALPMIDVTISVNGQSTICSNIGLHCRALVMVKVRAWAWQPDCKIQSGRNGQRSWCMSRVTAIISALLSASSSAHHGLLIITVITPLPTSPARQKCQRTEAGERGNYWHADASAWCCCSH